MAKGKTVFERAAQAAENGTSAECAKLIGELELIARAEAADLAATRGPQPVQSFDGQGRIIGTHRGEAGSRYSKAALSDDPKDLAAVIAEHARLSERAATIARLRHRLDERRKAAADEEARAAAPKRAAKAIAELDGAIDRLEAARDEYSSARAAVEGAIHELRAQRELSPDAPTLSLETFYRAGRALAHRLIERQQELGGVTSPARVIRPLFGDHSQTVKFARALLPGPSSSLVERIRATLRRITSTDYDPNRDRGTDSEVQARLNDWHHERVMLLHAGDVEQAAKLGAPEYQPGSRGRPTFGDAA